MIRSYITISVFLVLCSTANVFGIKCWSCQSDTDPKCADPFDNTTVPITNCMKEDGKWPMCRKIRQKVDGEWRISRGCALLDRSEIYSDRRLCLKQTESNETIIEDCSCLDRDGCNSSGIISPMPFMMLISVSIVYYKMLN
ncbi:jg5432 [Pararge aegeria aegeria]|uniref:Jg5432 protein n=2 Tax=Pararge aegeria TaxID=116150 RepID=A0A8S4SG31_9NEOP|nr:jg5432 [Pararge aegeria aegeria]